MKRIATGLALSVLLGLAACAETDTSSEAQTKNAALAGALVNGDFARGGGGWTGVGFPIDRGCEANTPTAFRPSLGAWAKNALAFGYRAAEVRQDVTVPQPSTVELVITGAVRQDDARGWFNVSLIDATEKKTTGEKTGPSAVSPTVYKLKVTTTTPNEKVTISLAGSGKNVWRGCYGPVLSNASLNVTSLAAPTTAPRPTTTQSTTTTSLPPTTTTTTTTITTTPPPTTTAIATCDVVVYGYSLTPCMSFTYWTIDWYAGEKFEGGSRAPYTSTERTLGLRSHGWAGNPTRAKVAFTLVDGSTTAPTFVPFDPNANVTITVKLASPATIIMDPPVRPAVTSAPTTTIAPIKGASVMADVYPNDVSNCDVTSTRVMVLVCKPVASYTAKWTRGLDKTETISTKTINGYATGFLLKDIGMVGPDSVLELSLTFVDQSTGSITLKDPWNLYIKTTMSISPPTAPLTPCKVSLELGDVRFCRTFDRYSYQWWSDTAELSPSVSNTRMIGSLIDLPEPPPGTTRVQITARLTDGNSIYETFIPYTR
jgi:hypothetical protein